MLEDCCLFEDCCVLEDCCDCPLSVVEEPELFSVEELLETACDEPSVEVSVEELDELSPEPVRLSSVDEISDGV